MALGALIRRRMASSVVSQLELAEALSMYQSQVSERLAGKRSITHGELSKIAEALKVSPLDLIPPKSAGTFPRLSVGNCVALSRVLGIGLGELFSRLAQNDTE